MHRKGKRSSLLFIPAKSIHSPYTASPGVEIVHGEFANRYEGNDLHDPAIPHTVHVNLREGREVGERERGRERGGGGIRNEEGALHLPRRPPVFQPSSATEVCPALLYQTLSRACLIEL